MRIAPRLLSLLAAFAALPLSAAISGSVMNADGQAIAGAKISLFAPETLTARRERLVSKTPERQALVTASADANGNFRIEPPKERIVVDLRVDAAGYAPSAIRLQSDDEAGALILTRAESKSATVKAAGKPLAGATVIWQGDADYIAVTDANGRYSVPDPAKWTNRLIIIHPDYARLEEGFQTVRKDLDRTLVSGVKVSGKVTGDDGAGVADAAIFIDGWPVGKSGADGAFLAEHTPKDWQEVHAISGARIAARAASAGALNLKLAKGATITGTVRDAKSQLPLAAADVMLSMSGQMGFAVRGTQTDAKGNFTISPLPAGSYRVIPSRPNYSIPSAVVSVTAGQPQSKPFFATAQARVSGVVVDEDKRPVAAARVSAQGAGQDGGPMMMMGRQPMSRSASSGPDGRFVVRVTQLDSDVTLSAAKRGYPPAKTPIMRLASGERKSGISLTIPRGVAFAGRVTDKNGKPLSGVTVDAAETQNDMGGMAFRRMMIGGGLQRGDENVTSASDGTFTIRLKEGKYDVIFKREGYAAKVLRAQPVAAGEKPVEVTMDPGVEISGRVVRNGAGIEGVNVNAFSQDGSANAVTGSDGSFTLADLTPGQMMLSVNKMDAMIQEIRPVTAPARDVVVELPAGGRITGRVVDKSTRRPITSFQAGVSTSRGGGGMMVMTPPMVRPFTSEDGSFTLENVKPGPTQVLAMAPGYTTGRAPNVEVEDGKTITEVEVALESGAKLVGKVTDSSGVPLSGVNVRTDMMGPGGSRVMRFDVGDTSAITDPNGEYTIDSLESGEKTFVFARSGYVSESKTVTLASGKDTRIDVTLGSGLRVGGVVVTEGGAPVVEATVRASSAAGGGRTAHTDAGGAFQLEGLAPGHYTFTASKTGMANGITRDVDVAASNNVRIVMKSGGTITGHVTGLSPQELTQASVMAQSPNGNASAPVEPSGNFRIEGAPSGTVRVTARAGQMFGGMKSAPPKTVELEPGGSAQVDIDFKSETVIRGRVTHNNQPVANANVNFMPRQGKAQTSASATADAGGNYELSGLEDGPYNVQVVDMQRMTPFNTTYDVHGSGNFDIDVRTASLRGRVIDGATGQPIADAQVDVRPRGSDSGFFGMRTAATDSNGTFVLDSVSRGSYNVSADKTGYGHEMKEVTLSETPQEIEFKLSPSAGVTLKVVDGRDGRTLGANVRVTDTQGRDLPGDTPFRFGPAGSNEPIKLALSPGTYRITVQAMSYASRTLLISSPSNQTVALTPGGSLLIHSKSSTPLRGRLTDSSGFSYLASQFNPTGSFRIVESPGTTTLQNVAPGHYRLDVLDMNDRVVKSIEVDVLEGRPATYDV